MTQGESILDRIGKQKEIWGLVFLVVILFSTFYVFTLPVPIDPMVDQAYRLMESYGKDGPNYGKPVLVMHAETYTDVLPLGTAIEAFWNHVKAKDIHIVVLTAHVETGQTRVAEDEMKRTWPGFPNVPEYGRSVVFLGWSVSQTMPVVWNDIWTAFGQKDYYGNSLQSLPLMKDKNPTHSLRDYEMVVSLSPWAGSNWVEMSAFGIKYHLEWAHEVQKGDLRKLIEMGWAHGGVCGPRMGLMYERSTGIPGKNSLLSTTTVMGVSYVIIGIVVSNVWYWSTRQRRKEE